MRDVIGLWRRWQACKMAAQVMQGRGDDVGGERLWSVTVFFESYMHDGAEVTQEDFGPKEPVNLRAVSK